MSISKTSIFVNLSPNIVDRLISHQSGHCFFACLIGLLPVLISTEPDKMCLMQSFFLNVGL